MWEEYDECLDMAHRLEYYLYSNHLIYSSGELYHLLGLTYWKKKDLHSSYHYFEMAASVFLVEDKLSYHIHASLVLAKIGCQLNKDEKINFKLEEIKEKINRLEDRTLAEKYRNKVEKLKKQFCR